MTEAERLLLAMSSGPAFECYIRRTWQRFEGMKVVEIRPPVTERLRSTLFKRSQIIAVGSSIRTNFSALQIPVWILSEREGPGS